MTASSGGNVVDETGRSRDGGVLDGGVVVEPTATEAEATASEPMDLCAIG